MKQLAKLGLIAAGLMIFSCKESNQPVVNNTEPINIEFIKEGTLQLKNGDQTIKSLDIELATNDNERSIGLMNRNNLAENQGMLFIFDQDNSSGFYMKDTRIPLDIIYLGSDSTVITISKMRKPFDLNSEGASKPYRYVLEVNGGKSDEWGIKEGLTKINWQNLP